MKCSYCGNELEKGADFCPECGMILGLSETREDKKSETQEPEFKVPEYTPNVFKAVDVDEEPEAPAMELESDGEEVTVPVTENIPEYVSQLPDNEPAEFEDVSSGVQDDTEDASGVQEEILVAPEYTPAPDVPAEDELDIRVPEDKITYPEYESYKNQQTENEVITPTEEETEETGSEDIYVEPSKKKNGALSVFLIIAVICVLVGGVYAMKNFLPSSDGGETTTTEAQQAGAVSEEDTTDAEDTTEAEEDTTEETTEAEEDTTEAEETETTTEEATENATEEEEASTAVTTTVPTTSKPVITTKPATTTGSATTGRPSATRPATTKPDPYGINDVTVVKPGKMGKGYTLYCTAEGVILRNAPSKSSERVLYLSKGADLTVYAKENGFYYVRSNRYGVYGWVSEAYTSESRPEAETTKVDKGTVTPDKKYDNPETRITTNGLNLRKGPGKDYDVIILIPKNYPVKVIGRKSGVPGWVYVTDTTYGHSGWVSSEYIK